MIEITKKDLLSNDFKIAMTKIATCTRFNSTTAYRVMRTVKLLESSLKDVQKDFLGVVKDVAKLDIKGNPLLNDDKSDYEFKEGITKEDAVKKLDDFVSGIIKINRDRFELDDFAPACLSPADLAMVLPLVNEPEVK
jgi:hypothetical protein